MRIGRLRHSITVEQLTSTAIAASGMQAGERTWSTTPLMTIWAGIEPLRGQQFIAAKGVQAEITHKVVLRYSTVSITPKNRIKFGTRVFDIDSIINPDERNEHLELMCREKV